MIMDEIPVTYQEASILLEKEGSVRKVIDFYTK
jgi:hypothetical protein